MPTTIEDEDGHVLDQLGVADPLLFQDQEVEHEIGQGLDGQDQQQEPEQQPEDEHQARRIEQSFSATGCRSGR